METELDYCKSILDLIPSAVALYTQDQRLLFCNRAFREHFGAEDGPLEGRHVFPHFQKLRRRILLRSRLLLMGLR